VHDRTLTVVEQCERALGAILARVRISAPAQAIGVAYSGGLDSSVLLHLMHDHFAGSATELFAFHIHHGISPNADAWLAHCAQEAARLGIRFDARRVELRDRGKSGTEEAARLARYAALGELCRAHRVSLLLTAHHQDDQAETVMLQLLRGSGVAGLSGMDAVNAARDLLGDAELRIGRPLLAVSRGDLERYASAHQIACIDDESNADTRYARNALRHHVMPALAQYFPGFQERVSRLAQHARSAQTLLSELAERDLELCADGGHLDVAQLRKLPNDRIDNLLRYWFHRRGIRMPSTAWLDELRTQCLDAGDDAQICVSHPDCHLRRYRGRLMLTPRLAIDVSAAVPQAFSWNDEPRMPFPAFGGSLYFERVEEGVDEQWLRQQRLVLRHRQGGEQLKLASGRPTRTLKQHYQSLGIPAWEREHLPLVFAGDDLLFAAGIGMDCRFAATGTSPKIRLHWNSEGC
jgi:tRNA(Ile)-lysidine synthase